MPTAISMPRLGMTMEEGAIVEWPLAVGARVEKGDCVLVIESEKAEVEIEAPASGVFRHAYVQPGEVLPCGALLGAITASADEPFDPDAFRAAEDRPASGGAQLQVRAPAAPAAPALGARAERPVVPAARALARKLGIDLQDVAGSGPNGRVTKGDVEAYAAAREARAPVGDGVWLEVLVDGSGDPLLLLPGLGTDVSAFARQTPRLAERFRVHGVNPRGVGLSDAPETDAYDVARSAADASAITDAPAHVIGASLGAAAAIELALAHPERVRTLTLITPFVEVSPRLAAVADAWARLAAEASPDALAAALLPWFFSPRLLADPAARARTLRGLAQTLARVPAAALARATAGMARWSGTRTADLAVITAPTLVVAAGDDLLTPDAAAVAAAIPGAKLVTVAGAGHAVALETPDAVNDAISAHLG